MLVTEVVQSFREPVISKWPVSFLNLVKAVLEDYCVSVKCFFLLTAELK